MKRNLSIGVLVALVLSCTGCLPRGETRTLDEVLTTARERFQRVEQTAVGSDVAQTIKQISARMEGTIQASAGDSAREDLRQVGDMLDSLILRAGYTSRPALGEISAQLRALGAAQHVETAQVKLVVARAYGLLASELETTKFAITQ